MRLTSIPPGTALAGTTVSCTAMAHGQLGMGARHTQGSRQLHPATIEAAGEAACAARSTAVALGTTLAAFSSLYAVPGDSGARGGANSCDPPCTFTGFAGQTVSVADSGDVTLATLSQNAGVVTYTYTVCWLRVRLLAANNT
jgi:hypothetical protein